MQEYANYHIVVIDDASEDETGTLIEKFLNEQQKVPKSRYNVIKNSKR
jgi:glycosyltransferase involved in cell wall biosynthesis